MAILSKIRNLSVVAIILIIGLPLLSFLINPTDLISFFGNKNSDTIGIVNGKEIPYTEYAARVESARQQAGNRNVRPLYFENQVWNQMVTEKIYETKLEESGVVISQAEVWQAILANPNIKNSPQFKNETGAFDENKVKTYLSEIKNDQTPQGKSSLKAWVNFEQAIKNNLLTQAYNNLISNGISISKQEATENYIEQNTKVSGEFVCLPYNTINNSEVKITTEEVASYIKDHKDEYQTEATRDVVMVKFPFKASQEDEAQIKMELKQLIEDKEEFNNITNNTELIEGFANTTDANSFIEEVGTDLPSDPSFLKETALTGVIKEEVKNSTKGQIVGPYKFSNYYKLSKVLDIQQIPDSVKASHILISYIGAQNAQNVSRTQQEAKVLADSILSVVTQSKNKFGELAENYSTDPGSASKKGDLGWFTYGSMVPEFRDFCFENKKGDLGVVKTNFGYHVISISDQKDFATGYKLATISRKIEASEATESKIFEETEIFAQLAKKTDDFKALAKEKGYAVNLANDIKTMDTYVGVLGQNRSVVRWLFENDTNVKDTKRFDLDEKGYAVVMVSNKQEQGLLSANKAFRKVEPILQKEKKIALLTEKMNATDLSTIASDNNVKVQNFNNVPVSTSILSGAGKETAVIGATLAAKKGELVKNIAGEKGVFAFVTNTVNKPDATDLTEAQVTAEITKLKTSVSRNILKALKENATIEDFRSNRY